MKKILLMTGIISLLLATNVIYARQINHSQTICNIENCLQTRAHIHNNQQEYNCYVDECPKINNPVHHNNINYNNCNNRMKQVNMHHNENFGHH